MCIVAVVFLAMGMVVVAIVPFETASVWGSIYFQVVVYWVCCI